MDVAGAGVEEEEEAHDDRWPALLPVAAVVSGVGGAANANCKLIMFHDVHAMSRRARSLLWWFIVQLIMKEELGRESRSEVLDCAGG